MQKPEYKCVKDPIELAKFLGLKDKTFCESEMDEELKKFIKMAKSKHRSSLPNYMWEKRQYHTQDVLEQLYQNHHDNIERISYDEVSEEEFAERFERVNKPCIITGVTQDWDVDNNWTWDAFNELYKDAKMKIAETDSGRKIKISPTDYYKYILHQKDDSPLYLFQSSFNELSGTQGILDRYKVPKYFKKDFFDHLGEDYRPPYRWFLIGPKRSGTTIHIDPNMTSAWNTSLNGHKLWVMFPYDYPKWIINGKNVGRNSAVDSHPDKGEDNEAIDYFWHHLSRIKQKEGELPGMVECIQYPGETIFVPGGWWHAVLNLDDTMAVTQNYCGPNNFDSVWRRMRVSRKKLSEFFLRTLRTTEPAFYKRALQLNRDDKFVFYKHRVRGNFVNDISTPTFTDSTSSSSSSSSYPDSDEESEDDESRNKKRDEEIKSELRINPTDAQIEKHFDEVKKKKLQKTDELNIKFEEEKPQE